MIQKVKNLIAKRDGIARKLKKFPIAERKPIKDELQQGRRRAKSYLRRSARNYVLETLDEENRKGSWKFIRQMTFSTPKGDKNQLDLDMLNEFLATTVQAPGPQADIQPTLGCDARNATVFNSANWRGGRSSAC